MKKYILTNELKEPIKWPLTYSELKIEFPDVSLPLNVGNNEDLNFYILNKNEITTYDKINYFPVDQTPVWDDTTGVFVQEQILELKSDEQKQKYIDYLINHFTATVQQHLDLFARTRNYDNIQSAVSYKGCGVQKFEVEADYCNRMRAQVWATLYTMLDEVLSGNREIPSSSTEVIDLLPVLEWPEI